MCRSYSSPFSGLQLPSATYRQNYALERVFALVFTPWQFPSSTWWRSFFWSISGENHYLQMIGIEAVQCLKQSDMPLSKRWFLLENVTAELPQVLMCLSFSTIVLTFRHCYGRSPLSRVLPPASAEPQSQCDTEGHRRVLQGEMQLTEGAGVSL